MLILTNMLHAIRDLFRRLVGTDGSFSTDADGHLHLALSLPNAWEELTQDQLHYICTLLCNGVQMDALKYYCFIHFSGFKVVSRWGEDWIIAVRKGLFRRKEMFISNAEVAALSARWLSFLDACGNKPIRLDDYKGRFFAHDAMLFGLPFEKFLMLENMWQGYLYSKDPEPLNCMAQILYADRKGKPMKEVPGVIASSVAIWFSTFKNLCYENWPNLYRKTGGEEGGDIDANAITNMQIRALTGGDITKEKEVLAMDCWRALTELDAKAHDAEEQRKEIEKMKRH